MNRLTICLALLLITGCDTAPEKDASPKKLPYIGHYDLDYSQNNGVQTVDTVYQPIRPFSYLNQDSIEVSNKSFANKIWIAEFFFATCPTICPIMNSEMRHLQREFDAMGLSNDIQFLSFSIDPKKDTPSALKEYKKNYCDSCDNWDFLTGNENFTHRLGIESFKIFSGREEEA